MSRRNCSEKRIFNRFRRLSILCLHTEVYTGSFQIKVFLRRSGSRKKSSESAVRSSFPRRKFACLQKKLIRDHSSASRRTRPGWTFHIQALRCGWTTARFISCMPPMSATKFRSRSRRCTIISPGIQSKRELLLRRRLNRNRKSRMWKISRRYAIINRYPSVSNS